MYILDVTRYGNIGIIILRYNPLFSLNLPDYGQSLL